jgi:hypothetical protein
MPQTAAPISRLKLNLPGHIVRVLEDWTYNELHSTPQEAVEAFLEELCVNGQLRLAVAEQLRRYSEDV